MAKWSSLTAGKIVADVSGGANSDWKYMAVLPVLIIIGIILYLIFRSDGPSGSTNLSTRQRSRLLNRSRSASVATASGPVGAFAALRARRERRAAAAAPPVAEPVAEPVVDAAVASVEPAAEPAAEITANELEPKFNVAVSKYWSFEEDNDEVPHLENDGNTFSDFQRAFSLGREYVAEENSMATYRNENHDTFMHDEQRAFVPKSDVSLSDSRTLATEAFQQVPCDMDRKNAAVLLREILAARTEAAHLGLNLGYSSDEQVSDLKYWSSKAGPEADLATAILSRI